MEIVLANPVLEATKNQQLQCKTTGANPPALVTWWIGNKQLIDAEISVSFTPLILIAFCTKNEGAVAVQLRANEEKMSAYTQS